MPKIRKDFMIYENLGMICEILTKKRYKWIKRLLKPVRKAKMVDNRLIGGLIKYLQRKKTRKSILSEIGLKGSASAKFQYPLKKFIKNTKKMLKRLK